MIHLKPLHHRLQRLALAIQQQSTQVQLTLGPLIPPRQPRQHLRSNRLDTWAHRLHLLRPEAEIITNKINKLNKAPLGAF